MSDVFIDASTSDNTVATSITTSVTVAGGLTDSALLVRVFIGDGSHNVSVSSATYNGVALTRFGQLQNGTPLFGTEELWLLVSPASGAHNAVLNFSHSVIAHVTYDVLTNVDQTTPWNVAGPHTGSGTGATQSIAATSVASELVVDVLGTAGTSTLTVDGAQIAQRSVAADGFGFGYGMSSQVASGTSTTNQWTTNASTGWFELAGSIRPASTPAVATKLSITSAPTVVYSRTVHDSVVVTIQDAGGSTVTTSTASVSLVSAKTSGGSSIFRRYGVTGTLTKNAVAGIATFDDLQLECTDNNLLATTGTYAASSSGLTGATTSSIAGEVRGYTDFTVG